MLMLNTTASSMQAAALTKAKPATVQLSGAFVRSARTAHLVNAEHLVFRDTQNWVRGEHWKRAVQRA